MKKSAMESLFTSIKSMDVTSFSLQGIKESESVVYVVVASGTTLLALILGCLYYRRSRLARQEEDLKLSKSVLISPADIQPVESLSETKRGDAEGCTGDGLEDSSKDPLEYCEHIPSEVKKTVQRVAQKKIEEKMTDDQLAKERDMQRQQMEAIFKLMQAEQDKFGISDMDDMQQQMKLYMQ